MFGDQVVVELQERAQRAVLVFSDELLRISTATVAASSR